MDTNMVMAIFIVSVSRPFGAVYQRVTCWSSKKRLLSIRHPGWGGCVATGALCPFVSVVRRLANLSLVKLLLSRSEESRIRQLPFPVMPTTNFESRSHEAKQGS